MDDTSLTFCFFGGFVHQFAHASCWTKLNEKIKDRIRFWSYEGQEPRILDQRV